MFQTTVLFVALRYIFSKTTDQFGNYIYWIVSFSIAAGTAMLIVMLSIMNGIERNLKQHFLYFTPHMLLTTHPRCVHIKNIPNLIFNKLYDIAYVQPCIISDVILQSVKKISIGSMLGVDPSCFEPLFTYLINNSINKLVSGKYYIIIGSALAHALNVHINDQIRLIIPSVMKMTPIGYVPSQRLFTILDIYTTNKDVDTYQVLVHRVDAAKLMHYPSEHYITGWRLWLRNPYLIDDLRELLLLNGWVCTDWREYKKSIFQAIQIEKNIMSLLLSLIIVAACFNIMSFLVLLVMEKQIEIAILQTYGFTRIQIMCIFIIQGINIGIFGIILGIIFGVLLAKNLNRILCYFNILPDMLPLPVEIQNYQILIITIITFIIIMLITLYPAWYAASVSPAKILHYK